MSERVDWRSARLGILGFGNMGQAIARGAIASGQIGVDRIAAFDASSDKLAEFAGIHAASALELAAGSDVLVIAVKPNIVPAVLPCIVPAEPQPSLVISIAAGVSLETLRSGLGPSPIALVRAMPNVAATVGSSTTAIIGEADAALSWTEAAAGLFGLLGSVVRLDREGDMHVFTALASSGPAFACVFAEALADAAVAEGMARSTARHAAASMLRGAGELLVRHAASPASWKDDVCSPGGTTIEGVLALEQGGFRAATAAAIRAATARSRVLGGGR